MKQNRTFVAAIAAALFVGTTIGGAAQALDPAEKPVLQRVEKQLTPTYKLSAGSRVVGGKEAKAGQIPWQVALFIEDLSDSSAVYLCGGSIIGNGWVLTAAHCVAGHGSHPGKVTALSNMTDLGSTTAKVAVATQVLVPGTYSAATQDFDVALVKVETRGKAISLATKEPAANSAVTVSGFGRTTENGETSDSLMFVGLSIKSRASCNAPPAYNGAITANMVCAAKPNKDSCQGDSGGPLYSGSGTAAKLVGIVSWGEGCARPGKYGVYTNVASDKVQEWIKENAK